MKVKPETFFISAGLVFLLLTLGCSGDNAVNTYRVDKAPVQPAESIVAATVAPSGTPAGWLWQKPATWLPTERSSMQLAKFLLPLEGSDANCSLMVLSGSGGGLVANVNRWRQQLGLETNSEAEIEAALKTEKGLLGNFSFLRIEGPGPVGDAFLIAIQPLEGQTLFIKLIAPLGDVDQMQEPFLAFCKSVRKDPGSAPGH